MLDLARRHVAAVEERIQQLTRFRDQLAGEISKWDGTLEPTCRGLCQIIVNAEEQPAAGVRVEIKSHRQQRRSRGQRR